MYDIPNMLSLLSYMPFLCRLIKSLKTVTVHLRNVTMESESNGQGGVWRFLC